MKAGLGECEARSGNGKVVFGKCKVGLVNRCWKVGDDKYKAESPKWKQKVISGKWKGKLGEWEVGSGNEKWGYKSKKFNLGNGKWKAELEMKSVSTK